MKDDLDRSVERRRVKVLRAAARAVVGNYTHDPDVTNDDRYEVGAADVETLRAALAAWDSGKGNGIGKPRSSGGLLNDEGIPM